MKTNPRRRPRTARETNDLVQIILSYLPAIILASAVLVLVAKNPNLSAAAIGAITTAIKALWR